MFAHCTEMKESQNGDNVLPVDEQYPWNLCGGVIGNLAAYEAMTDVLYFIGGLLFAFFLVSMPLRLYYTYMYPSMFVAIMICMCIGVFIPMPTLALLTVTGIAQVIAYMATDYGYYAFTTYSKARSYGVALAVYNFLTIMVELISGLIIIIPLPAAVLILFLTLLAIFSVVYSLFIALWGVKTYAQEVEDKAD